LLGIMALEHEDWTNAETSMVQALDTARESGYQWAIASALHNLGDLVHRRGDHPRALALYRESLLISWDQRDRWSVAVTLPALAEVLASLGDTEQAIRLFGAASSLGETIATRLVAAIPIVESYQQIVSAARGILGEAAFESAWNGGQSLTGGEAIEEADRAVELRLQSPAPAAPAEVFPAGLSKREVEVIRLVSAGLTNAQVADQLYLSRRTVDAHLRRIYDKLDLSSRATIVRFAQDHNLL
jgi:non-specific serine/threonine protein kinase